MLIKGNNGKAPARKRQSVAAPSSTKSSRSNSVPKSRTTNDNIKAADKLDGNIICLESRAVESEAGDRILEETGIDDGTPGGDLPTEPTELTAITLHQPWASLIAAGHKVYETRDWPTTHRGSIAIHAGRKPKSKQELREHDKVVTSFDDLLTEECSYSSIIAIAEMTDCILMTEEFISQQTETELRCGGWQVGRYAFKLENVRAIEPVPATGKQGLWKYIWNSAESIQLMKVGDRLANGIEFATISIITGKDAYLKRDSGGSICLPVAELKSFGWELSTSWNPVDFGEAEYKVEANGQLNFLEVSEPPEPDDYESIELFDAAYKSWCDAQTDESEEELANFGEQELCKILMDGSIFAAESVSVSLMQESNCGEEAPTISASGTTTATQSLEEDTQIANSDLATSKQSNLKIHNSAVEYNLSLLHRLVSHSQLRETDSLPETIETVSRQSLPVSTSCNPNLQSLKMLPDFLTVQNDQEATNSILLESLTSFPKAGTMSNGRLSAAPTLPALGVEKESLLLRSPGALSTTKGRPPGKTKLESQLHQLVLIQDGEVVNPEFLEAGYHLPIGFTNLQENRTALELSQVQAQQLPIVQAQQLPIVQAQQLPIDQVQMQQSIDLKSELLAETAITAIDVQPLAMLWTGESLLLDSSELNICLTLPPNIGVLTKTELISMATEQHQLICVIERKEFELAIEKLHRVRLTGVYLQEFKKKCQHGEFENQLKQAGISIRSAQNYMAIAKNWEIVEAKTKLVSLLAEESQPAIGLKWALEAVRDEKRQLKSAAPPKDPDSWRTPDTKEQPIVSLVKQALGGSIWLDPCSDSSAKVSASVRYFKDDDGLAEHQTWSKTVFINPPFSNPSPWVEKCCLSIARGNVSAAIMLLKAGTVSNVGTGELISKYASAVCHWRGRINFLNDEGYAVKGSDFDCVFIYFGDRVDLFRKAFSGRGTISTIDNHFSSVNKKYLNTDKPAFLDKPDFNSIRDEEKQLAAAVGLSNGRSILPDTRDQDRDLMERHDPHTVTVAAMTDPFNPIEQPKISAEIESISAEFQQAKSDCFNDYITAISGNITDFSDEQLKFLIATAKKELNNRNHPEYFRERPRKRQS
jgi:hypothetical protein